MCEYFDGQINDEAARNNGFLKLSCQFKQKLSLVAFLCSDTQVEILAMYKHGSGKIFIALLTSLIFTTACSTNSASDSAESEAASNTQENSTATVAVADPCAAANPCAAADPCAAANPCAAASIAEASNVRYFVDDSGLAIRGTDPVAYFTQGGPVAGSAEFTHTWSGATWQFASAENRDLFAANPELYAPQYGGFCAWAVSQGYTADIDPNAWKIVDNKLYLNFNRSVQRRWERDIPGNIGKADANWPGVLSDS